MAQCLLCGSNRANRIAVGVRYDPSAEVWRCSDCGLAWLWPRPTLSDLDSYYAHQYRVDYGNVELEDRFEEDASEASLRAQRLAQMLSPQTALLEVGSGSGAFLSAIRSAVNRVVGIEPDTAARSWMRQKLDLEVVESVDVLPSAPNASI